ncbi:MAG: histidine triad nucleotide-binding protein [Candidatus Woykebacteria bacterium RIFCSPHIGHO2_12_FULL_43_10]|uniref:Histidine triad nucleotide-binding protein n=2 Tax=Candidatus Woykeibacteriota TaxID=1817899 RepID=A0A1G1WU10_9BACT|nr:MAG: histidine triad nucleotide-binding protein [Candidatus Woykebacteria bacterium RIFCSPHIGHO2_01_FULL_43_29]OGY29716.1 MAG: histidine triad nucleotide-binding protein [Candidatus Woykebacteria bacterium RIFCSPHIGHO2_02_FULL_43_16b]OGY30408.1 MAG: histidine triad nucleotide-binding protein [Candidatus Woykebacteria bacterium RIFCSPHIGHO2_12_FULL_43_10]OGY30810.1 MAG: histidine triad nucleotide-binding protein [Candidatus Woykebacteria bacterium RIFCSPLOWO2_01_FULL_43_14]
MTECIFCKIVAGSIPSKKVYEDEHILAFHTMEPQAPKHILVVPKKHISRLADVGEENLDELGRCQVVAAKIAKDEGIGEAFRVVINSGEKAGQSVFHIHYHLLGGWEKTPDDSL